MAVVPCQADSTLTFSSGIDYSTGKYGDVERTDTTSIPFGLRYEFSDWTLRASIPYVESSGPANVVGVDGDLITLNSGQNTRRRVSGLGDLVLSASWTALQRDHWLVEFGTKVKLATGNKQDGLSTGKTDYSLQTEIYRALDKHTLFGTLGYKKMGDPDGVALRDPFYGSLGWSLRTGPSTSVGLIYDYRQKIQETGAPIREATAFLTQKFGDNWKIQAYAATGFSRASADLSGGLFAFYTY